MFGNLRLYERPPTLLAYQVLPKQNQFVTLVFPLQFKKKEIQFLFYELPFKFALIFYALTHQILCSSPILLYFDP